MTTCRNSTVSETACNNNCIPEFDDLGLPLLPEVPTIPLCLHIPWTDGWYTHWTEFNKRAKDFHQAMIDFNWRVLEWYSLKSKQLDRFGTRHPYIAGTVISGGRMTIIYAKTINDGEVICEIKKCLPNAVKEHVKQLERKAYKLCLTGKVFLFDCNRVVVIDYDKDSEKTAYRNCLKFTLYRRNEKININEAVTRVYGGLKHSFIIGGVGGLVVGLLTGYFGRPPIYARRLYTNYNLVWLVIKRSFLSSILYTIVERILLLKFPKPQKYLLSGSAGVICGSALGLLGKSNHIYECDFETTICGASEYGIFAFLCNAFLKNQSAKGTVGCDTESY
ncbi:unnamed protein product [Orchesella dallaii]|uniref:Uncharacterized protein n=1 Tax=Orchesella dallaii TaxID=48710 RepID=A0ABP1QBM9_9HEXA